MKYLIKFGTALIFCLSVSVVFAQNDNSQNIAEKLKILEGHQKNLEESYKNKLDDLNKKFLLTQNPVGFQTGKQPFKFIRICFFFCQLF